MHNAKKCSFQYYDVFILNLFAISVDHITSNVWGNMVHFVGVFYLIYLGPFRV